MSSDMRQVEAIPVSIDYMFVVTRLVAVVIGTIWAQPSGGLA